MNTFILNPGTYYIVDPVSVLSELDFKTFLKSYKDPITNKDNNFLKIRNLPVVFFSIKTNRDTFSDNDGYAYVVNSGCIGCIPESLVLHFNNDGRKIRVKDGPLRCFKSEDTLIFGSIMIETGYEV